MATWIKISQIFFAFLMMLAILLQNRGSGLSGIFGGSDNVYRTKRGVEKTLFIATIGLAVAFFLASLLSIVIK
jgi:preprotein translocase subunit SecG